MRIPLLCFLSLTLAGIGGFAAPAAANQDQLEPAARIIHLVRHGHYLADPQADPDLGPTISTLGVTQAKRVGERLGSLPERYDHLYVSPMQRAQDTAAQILPSLEGGTFETLADLRECTPTTWRQAVIADEPASALADCEAQLERLFRAHFKPAVGHPSQELMVCHGNVIRYLITRALGVDSQAWLEMSVGHASLTRIRIESDGSFKLIAAGDVGHLPAVLQSGASGDPEIDQATASGLGVATTADDRRLLQLKLDRFLAGASRNDAAVHADFWAEELVYTSSSGTRFGKAQLMASLAAAAPQSDHAEPLYRAEELDIRLYGDTAVVAFTLVADSAESDADQRYYNTGTFARRKDGWRAVAWQATRIPSPASADSD